MKTMMMQEWEDINHISNLMNESPARALKLINTGISEKAAILMHKNFGIRLDQSLLSLKDSYLNDVLGQMTMHSLVEEEQAEQIISYKRMLNGRNEDIAVISLKQLCLEGLLILTNL